MHMSKVSIRDVAALAGVSTATVSHVINNTRYVKEETKRLVLKSIEELHYSPDATARSFKTGKRNLIAFIVPDISNPFFATMIEETKEREIDNLRILSSGIVDGFVLASTVENYSDISGIVPPSIPVVLVDRSPLGAPYDSVISANYQAMSDGVEYLIKKGHSKIGFITGIPRISTTKERLDAYRDTMEKHGIFSEALIRTGTSMTSLVVENLDALLALGCTALVISNNIMAIETMMILNQRGIRPHHDIDLIGYKDSEQAQYGLQHMSLIKQPVAEMGRATGKQLLERLSHPDMPIQRIILPAEFLPVD